MYTTNLRKMEGAVVLAIPPVMLDAMGLSVGTKVNVSIDGGRIVVEQRSRPFYTLEELLAQCDPRQDFLPEEKDWLESAAVGEELL
ncbi:MAG: antitoxin [Synergistaceae bacterium]|nr:antitoxin [Synergistaceae bacterium]